MYMKGKDVPMVRSVTARRIEEGEGATALRLLGEGTHLDPFVLFDDYTIPIDASFPFHPHSGFEGFQFLMEGSTRYEDDRGNVGVIGPGGARRFLCTEGFRHSERPVGEATVRGFLLWVRLPRGIAQPSRLFRQVSRDDIPVSSDDGLRVRTVVGPGSPLGSSVPFSFEVLERVGTLDLHLEEGENCLVHVSSGSASFNGAVARKGEGLLMNGPLRGVLAITERSVAALVKGRALGGFFIQDGPNVR
jgi:redox-sensitive bicupin YhaK (pirin superfamily)